MKDITIILPIHEYNEDVVEQIKKSLSHVMTNRQTYKDGELFVKVIGPSEVINKLSDVVASSLEHKGYDLTINDMNVDFCSQINEAVKTVTTDFFSILEFDDFYTDKWFKMAKDYFYTNENVSVFLPINILTDGNTVFQYANEIAWSSSFSKEIGYLDYDCLQDYSSFNITGGIFNTKDFIGVGGLKPSIKVYFGYEFLLRLTKKELKVYVVPKEGYLHTILRSGSLTDHYAKTMNEEDLKKWLDLAKIECNYKEDRGTTIENISEETLK